ncbi:hypothetical protein QBC43DRAFT_366529 [Cladorrhinum sp. PSN259]|nr:hypothetical protein QBC43DRAFT_366529 [Cladorrhinum sp. PSN259]
MRSLPNLFLFFHSLVYFSFRITRAPLCSYFGDSFPAIEIKVFSPFTKHSFLETPFDNWVEEMEGEVLNSGYPIDDGVEGEGSWETVDWPDECEDSKIDRDGSGSFVVLESPMQFHDDGDTQQQQQPGKGTEYLTSYGIPSYPPRHQPKARQQYQRQQEPSLGHGYIPPPPPPPPPPPIIPANRGPPLTKGKPYLNTPSSSSSSSSSASFSNTISPEAVAALSSLAQAHRLEMRSLFHKFVFETHSLKSRQASVMSSIIGLPVTVGERRPVVPNLADLGEFRERQLAFYSDVMEKEQKRLEGEQAIERMIVVRRQWGQWAAIKKWYEVDEKE